jgi:MscS family membrane protein
MHNWLALLLSRQTVRTWFGMLMMLCMLNAHAQTGETTPTANPTETAQEKPETWRETLKASRNRLAEHINTIQHQAQQNPRNNIFKQQLLTLKALDGIYLQQILAQQNTQTLTAEQQQYQEDLINLSQTVSDQSASFTDLVRTHEELSGMTNRKLALKAKLSQAHTLLSRAQKEIKNKQTALDDYAAEKPPTDKQAQQQVELLKSQLDLAQQTLRLREIEVANATLALKAFDDQEQLLLQRAKRLEQYAVFTESELNNQLQEIDKDIFTINRQLSKTSEQQPVLASRLTEAQRRLANASLDRQIVLTEEVEARHLADEAAKISIDLLRRRIDGLADWKTVWQQGYKVFNQVQQHSDWLKWKSQAKERIDALDQEERLIPLWLSDWQKQQVTLENELAGKLNKDTSAWIKQQHQSVEKIITAYREQKTFLENSRRLQQKLIDLITNKTNHRNWQEWLSLAWDYELYGNHLGHWCGAAGSAIGLFMLLFFVRNFLIKRLQKHAEADDAYITALFFASVRRTTTFFLFMISLFLSAFWLSLDAGTSANLKHFTMVALIFQGAVWMSYFFKAWMQSYLGAKARRDNTSKSALSIFNFISQAVVWSIAFMLILQNIGVDVTALATGLGIGGVAVALALQRILGDLFASLSIVLDKPFVAGDFVIFDQILGTVEHIGIKTTRIRSLDGEQIICTNSDLLNTRIRNFQRMRERRVVFQIGVVYQTRAEQLAQIPQIFADIVMAQNNVRFDRAHFKAYGDFALTYEVVYYVNSPDYNLYMDIQQAINLAIFQRFQAEDIGFAYPTHSIHLQTNIPANDASSLVPA